MICITSFVFGGFIWFALTTRRGDGIHLLTKLLTCRRFTADAERRRLGESQPSYCSTTVSSHRLRVRQKVLCCDRAVADDNDGMTDHDESIAEHYNCLGCATAMECLARTTSWGPSWGLDKNFWVQVTSAVPFDRDLGVGWQVRPVRFRGRGCQ